uniref:BRD4-interacting chromatin-remodeling complex-associated protein-like n=1 Tax=Salmo trutta TaxID=8032 RepID=A0A673WS06_SALTR
MIDKLALKVHERLRDLSLFFVLLNGTQNTDFFEQANSSVLYFLHVAGSCMETRARLSRRPRAACTSIVSVDMDDEDGRCLLDVICDPEALNDFLHGSEIHCHVPEVPPPVQLSSNEQQGLPRVSVDLDFLEDDVILGGSPGDDGSNGIGGNATEPCDILQQSLQEANITEQSLQEANITEQSLQEANITEQSLAEAEAELDLGSFDLTMPGLTQVVQTLPCTDSLTGPVGTAVGVGLPIFPGASDSSATPPQATADMLGSVLAQQGLEFGPQVMNKAQAISMQPFMQQVAGLGNVTLQPISSLQALPNGCQSGHLGLGQIQVMGQSTVMTMNQSGQPILAKGMGGYQLHQPGPEAQGAGGQGGLGGGLLIQGGKATLGPPALNGPAVCGGSSTTGALVGFSSPGLAQHGQNHPQGQIMQNLIIQRTPTPIQPKPPQGGAAIQPKPPQGGAAIQPKLFKQQQQQAQPHTFQNDTNKALGVQHVPVSTAQNVAFLTGKPGSNVVLTSQAGVPQQALFKQQTAHHPSGKALSVHLLNQPGSIMLGGQNHQFLLPQQLAGGQILTQHPGGHIITSQGPGGQLIANQILAQHQNINLGQVLMSQGHIQLQPGQIGVGHQLFQMPVTLSQNQTHPVTGHQAHTVIQGMPLQNSLAMLSQVEGVSPAVSLQPALQPQPGGVPSSGMGGAAAMAQGQPGEGGSCTDQAAHPGQPPQHSSILSMQAGPSVSVAVSVPSSSSPSAQQQHSPGSRVLFTGPQGSSMILSQEQLQMFLQQVSMAQLLPLYRYLTTSTPHPSTSTPLPLPLYLYPSTSTPLPLYLSTSLPLSLSLYLSTSLPLYLSTSTSLPLPLYLYLSTSTSTSLPLPLYLYLTSRCSFSRSVWPSFYLSTPSTSLPLPLYLTPLPHPLYLSTSTSLPLPLYLYLSTSLPLPPSTSPLSTSLPLPLYLTLYPPLPLYLYLSTSPLYPPLPLYLYLSTSTPLYLSPSTPLYLYPPLPLSLYPPLPHPSTPLYLSTSTSLPLPPSTSPLYPPLPLYLYPPSTSLPLTPSTPLYLSPSTPLYLTPLPPSTSLPLPPSTSLPLTPSTPLYLTPLPPSTSTSVLGWWWS